MIYVVYLYIFGFGILYWFVTRKLLGFIKLFLFMNKMVHLRNEFIVEHVSGYIFSHMLTAKGMNVYYVNLYLILKIKIMSNSYNIIRIKRDKHYLYLFIYILPP